MRESFKILFVVIFIIIHQQEVYGQDFKIGSPCRLSDECVQNSECVLQACQCKPGFTILSSLECRMDYNGKCSIDSDCNTPMGLHCLDSLCKCSGHLGEEYVPTLGACMNTTSKMMYEDIVNLINQTEFELSRFTTLLNIFMIHSSSNVTDSSASKINPEADVYKSLHALEQQLEVAAQNPIPSIIEPQTNEIQEAKAQVESPQSAVPIPPGIPELPVPPVPEVPVPNSVTPELPPPSAPGIEEPPPTNLPNSINSLRFKIIPDDNNLGNGMLPPAPGSNNPQNSLGNVLPHFLTRFRQFVPMLQSFNNVLGSSVLQSDNQNRQNVNPTRNRFQSPLGGLISLLNVPIRIIQIPGRLFNSYFGPNSAIGMLKRRLIPIDFSDRPIQLLPWPLG